MLFRSPRLIKAKGVKALLVKNGVSMRIGVAVVCAVTALPVAASRVILTLLEKVLVKSSNKTKGNYCFVFESPAARHCSTSNPDGRFHWLPGCCSTEGRRRQAVM